MFRFSIRDVLWLTVVVGFVLGWWVEHQRLSQKEIALDGLVDAINGCVQNQNSLAVDLKVVKSVDATLVFAEYGTDRDREGRLIGTRPGGHTTYLLSKSGKIERIIGGL
jgi:hypothetical protein